MANRFQTPIDNQFIDTYVPIPFTELMNAAAIKQDRWDKASSSLLEAESSAQAIKAIEGTPDAAYRDEVVNYMKDRANYYTSGAIDLSDPLVQNQINSDLRKIDQVRLQNIGASRTNWDAERAQEDELRAKGQWNDKLYGNWSESGYNDPWLNWDSRKGIYTGSAEAEIQTANQLQPYFEGMEEEFWRIAGNDPTAFTTYAMSGVGRDRIRTQAASIANQLKDSAWADQQLKLKYGTDYKNKVSVTEQQQYIKGAIENYAVELWTRSSVDEFSSAGSGSGSTNTPWNPADIQFMQGAKDSILTQEYDSRNANKIVKEVDADLKMFEDMIAADDMASRVSPSTAMSESQREFIEGKVNMLRAQQTAARIAADKMVGEGPQQLYDATLQSLMASGMDKNSAESLMASVVGSGLGTIGDKFTAIGGDFAKRVYVGAKGLSDTVQKVAATLTSLVPDAYYNITDDPARKKEKIAADIEKLIQEAGGDVEHSATLGDYVSEYISSVSEKSAALYGAMGGGEDTLTGPVATALKAASTALSSVQDYKKQMKDYSDIYEDTYAKTLQSNLQYTVSGIDITLPTYSKMTNSDGYKIAETNSESRIVKWFDTLSSYKDGVVISATNNKGKELKQDKALDSINDLDWSTISDKTISTAPEFDKDGNPYLTIKFASGVGENRKQYNIKVAYDNPAINSIKEDLLIQGTQPTWDAYIALNNTEIAAKIRQSANSVSGAEITIYTATGSPYSMNVKLNHMTGKYSFSSDYPTTDGQPLYAEGLTIEEAEAIANNLTAAVLQQQ